MLGVNVYSSKKWKKTEKNTESGETDKWFGKTIGRKLRRVGLQKYGN